LGSSLSGQIPIKLSRKALLHGVQLHPSISLAIYLINKRVVHCLKASLVCSETLLIAFFRRCQRRHGNRRREYIAFLRKESTNFVDTHMKVVIDTINILFMVRQH